MCFGAWGGGSLGADEPLPTSETEFFEAVVVERGRNLVSFVGFGVEKEPPPRRSV